MQELMKLSFSDAAFLFSPAYALHVCEEWGRFATWARKHASPQFTDRRYQLIHLAGIATAVLASAIVGLFPFPVVLLAFYTLVFTPSMLFNAIFHCGASLMTRTYCPGLITSLTVYLPLFAIGTAAAYDQGLMRPRTFATTLAISGAFHVWEVGHNVFKRW